jgi:hypothetical protein
MQLLIDEVKLNLLLEQKKQYIGRTVAVDSIVSSLSFLISVALASYGDIWGVPGIVFKTVFVILGIAFTAKSLFDIYQSKKNNYNYEDLLEDINKLNEITHKHSIVIIKDTYQEFSNRYLVYDDSRWNCMFFLNYKDNENNENFIKGHISNELKIKQDDISLKYLTSRVHQKYSVSGEENRMYSHKFYLAMVSEFPEYMKNDTFECDGRVYHWKSIPELESDSNVIEHNLDIVNYVKELV